MFCFGRVFDWEILDCSGWLFLWLILRLIDEVWCGRRKIKVCRCIATFLLLNPVSKWVRSDSNGWSFNLGVYCLLWKRFCVLNVALRMTKKLNRLRNSDGHVLVFKKTQRVVWPCFNCVDFMAQTVAAYSSAHKCFWLKKNNYRNAPWKMWPIRIERYRCQNADISTLLWKMLACSTKSTTAFAFSKNHLKSRRFRLWTSFPSCF